MNKVIKEMKEICAFKDNETEIRVQSSEIDPYYPNEFIKLETTINGVFVSLFKDMKDKK